MKEEIMRILGENPVFLDTETTGLDSKAEIVEIAILDLNSNPLFESLVKPTIPVQRGAYEVHRIDDEMLNDAPAWTEVVDDVESILTGNTTVIYNASYDIALLHQSSKAHDLNTKWIERLDVFCAMKAAAEIYPDKSSNGRISLKKATSEARLKWDAHAHRALADADMTVRLMKAMAS